MRADAVRRSRRSAHRRLRGGVDSGSCPRSPRYRSPSRKGVFRRPSRRRVQKSASRIVPEKPSLFLHEKRSKATAKRTGTARKGDRPPALRMLGRVVPAPRRRDLADQLAAFAQNFQANFRAPHMAVARISTSLIAERSRRARGDTVNERRSGPGEQRASCRRSFLKYAHLTHWRAGRARPTRRRAAGTGHAELCSAEIRARV